MGKQKKRKHRPTETVPQAPTSEIRPRLLQHIGAILLLFILIASVVVPLTLGTRPGADANKTPTNDTDKGASTLASYGTNPSRLSVPSERDFKLLIPGPHRSPITQIVFNQTGRYFASLGSQNDIKIWDTERQTLISELVYNGKGKLLCLAFGPETGTDWAMVGGLDSGELLYIDRKFRFDYRIGVQSGHPIRNLLLSGDESSIVAIGEYHCSLVNIKSGEVLEIDLFWHNNNHFCPRLTYNGKPLEDENPGKRIEYSIFGIRSWAVAKDSPLLALGCANLYLQTNPRPLLEPIQPGKRGIYRLYSDPSQPRLQPDGKRGHGYGAANPPNVLSVDKDRWRDPWKLIDAYSSPFLLTTLTEMALNEYDIEPWSETDLTQLRSIFGMDFNSSGDLLATVHDDNYLRLWSTKSHQDEVPDNAVVGGHSFDSPLCGVKFSPNGTQIAVAEADKRRLRIHVLKTISTKEAPDLSVLVDETTKKATFAIVPGEEAPLQRSIDIPELDVAPNTTTLASLSWTKDSQAVFVWSWRTGDLHWVPTKQGKPLRVAQNVTAFAAHASSDRIAFGDGDGNVRLRDCAAPTTDIFLLSPSVPGNVLMPEEALFPPPWVFTPYGTLTLTEALTGRLLLREADPTSWSTFLSGSRAFVFTGKGRLFDVDLSGEPRPTREFASPLGSWGNSAPVTGNQSMEYLFARLYGVETVPKGQNQVTLKPYDAWTAGPRIANNAYVSVVHSKTTDQLVCAGGTAQAVFSVNLKTGAANRLLIVPRDSLCRLSLGGGDKYVVAWWIEDAERPNTLRTMRGTEQALRATTRIAVLDLMQGKVARSWSVPGICSALSTSRDANRVAGVWGSTVRVWELPGGKELLNEQVHAKIRAELYLDPWASVDNWQREQFRPWFLPSVALSPDGETIYLWDETRNFQHRRFSEKGWKGNVHVIDTQVMARPAWKRGKHLISKSGRWIAFSGDGNSLRLLDTTTREMRLLTGHLGFAYPACFSTDERFLITSGGDGALRTWQLDPLDEVVEFRMFANGDWLARTPDGYWDGSADGLRRAKLVYGTAVGELGSNYGLWRFGLVEQILEGGKIEDQEQERPRAALFDRPEVRVSGPLTVNASEVTLKVKLAAKVDPLKALLVFANGKLVTTMQLNLATRETRSIDVDVPLSAGANRIEIVAGTTGQTRSDKASVVVRRTGAPPSRLFVVSVGVNGENVRYARSDAIRVAETLRQCSAALYSSPYVVTVLDAEATKAGIARAVGSCARLAEPQDIFVFYFAGHGNVYEQTGARMASLTTYDSLGKAPNSGFAVTSKDITDWTTLLEPQRQLWVFDACGTGTLTSQFGAVAFSRDFRRLQSNVGCYVIAAIEEAPDGAEEIKERASLRGGVLTTALLEFLSGRDSGSVEELGRYVTMRVPQLYGASIGQRARHAPAVLAPPEEIRAPFLLKGH